MRCVIVVVVLEPDSVVLLLLVILSPSLPSSGFRGCGPGCGPYV